VNFHPRRSEEPELNMTSLIDVVLLLLIFFMLSTRFIDEGRLQLRLPEAGAEPEAVQPDAIEIEVTAQGGYRVNGRALASGSPEALGAAIAQVAGSGGARPVIIRADARATHQSVVTAMDVAGRAGFRQLSIATVGDGRTEP
jgi:biopolymer transport protein ExbD